MCGGLQHQVAAARDRQEGARLLAAALFASVQERGHLAQLAAEAAQMARHSVQQVIRATGAWLKTNKSGATKERIWTTRSLPREIIRHQ